MEKFLPVGIQSFEQMITGNFLYVDKTRYIYDMVRPPQGFYFLARPRRFGKSLTVSTFEALFKGKRNLFADLQIVRTDWEWQCFPVLKIDFTQINSETPEKLEASLLNYVYEISDSEDIKHSIRSLPDCFVRLIIRLAAKYQKPVVVLADEYDKPIIDHLGKGEKQLEIAKNNRDKLKQFFGVLKGGDVSAVLRFVFITGVSKFSRVSIFSELNNLEDITMAESYTALLGYTKDELETYFKPFVKRLAEKRGDSEKEIMTKLARYYDGYRFSESDIRVYNPFSVLSALKKKAFKNYWFETGTPSFLINLLRENNWYLPGIEGMQATEAVFSTYELENLQPEALLFQTPATLPSSTFTKDFTRSIIRIRKLRHLFWKCCCVLIRKDFVTDRGLFC